MKYLAILAILGFAYAIPFNTVVEEIEEEEGPAKAMIECIRHVLDGGLESANIPDHNPFRSPRVITVPIDLLGITGNITMHDIVISKIINFDIKSVKGTKTQTGANYSYSLYWPDMVVDVAWEGKTHDIFGDHDKNGTIKLVLKELFFDGYWNQTFPTKDKTGTLDGFQVLISSDVELDFKGLGTIVDKTISVSGSLMINTLLRTMDQTPISTALQKRMNDVWLSNGTRIDAMLTACKANHTILF